MRIDRELDKACGGPKLLASRTSGDDLLIGVLPPSAPSSSGAADPGDAQHHQGDEREAAGGDHGHTETRAANTRHGFAAPFEEIHSGPPPYAVVT